MEVTAQSLCGAKLPICSSPPSTFHSKPSLLPFNSILFHSPNSLHFPHLIHLLKPKPHNNFGIVLASASESTSSDSQDRWLLQPVGNGDWRHIGYKVKLPDAFEISSSEVTVGRVPEKADLVIPVATVSGVHARIQKNGGNLLVTDLDSTNGTFIGDKRLTPGVAAVASSGSLVTFGDTNLAIFRVSRIVNAEDSQDK